MAENTESETNIPQNQAPSTEELEQPKQHASVILSNQATDIYSISGEEDQNLIKEKLSKKLKNLNRASKIYADFILDYNFLYKKYVGALEVAEKGKMLNAIQMKADEKSLESIDKKELTNMLTKLKDELNQEKSKNNENLTNLSQSLQDINKINTKVNELEKEKEILTTEINSLKQSATTNEKRRKELNGLCMKLEKEKLDLQKENDRLENDYKTAKNDADKYAYENKVLTTKVNDLKAEINSKLSNYNELMESAKNTKEAAEMYFNTKSQEFKEEKKDINIDTSGYTSIIEACKVPTKLKYKQKSHNRGITSINFNGFGSSYITTGADFMIRVFDASKNTETNVFSGFSSAVSEACFDHSEQFLFAGSLDKTAKLWSLKNNKLVTTYTGHIDYINCVKSFNATAHGLTGSSDRSIREWDFNTKQLVKKYNCISSCHAISISPDDSYILSGHKDGSIKLWASNDKPEKVFDLHEDKVCSLEMLKNEFQFLSLGKDDCVKLFDIRKEIPIYTINESKITQHCESSISISTDKKYFSIGSTKGTIYIFQLIDGKLESTINNKSNYSINSVYWRPFNSQIYVGDSGGYLTIWDN